MSGDPVLAALARLEAKMEERLATLDGRLQTLDGRLATFGERLEALDGRIERLEAVQTRLRVDLMERMDRFEDRLTAFGDDLVVNMGGVNTVFDRLAAVRKEGDATASMLQTVIRQVNRLQNEVEALKKRPA